MVSAACRRNIRPRLPQAAPGSLKRVLSRVGLSLRVTPPPGDRHHRHVPGAPQHHLAAAATIPAAAGVSSAAARPAGTCDTPDTGPAGAGGLGARWAPVETCVGWGGVGWGGTDFSAMRASNVAASPQGGEEGELEGWIDETSGSSRVEGEITPQRCKALMRQRPCDRRSDLGRARPGRSAHRRHLAAPLAGLLAGRPPSRAEGHQRQQRDRGAAGGGPVRCQTDVGAR